METGPLSYIVIQPGERTSPVLSETNPAEERPPIELNSPSRRIGLFNSLSNELFRSALLQKFWEACGEQWNGESTVVEPPTLPKHKLDGADAKLSIAKWVTNNPDRVDVTANLAIDEYVIENGLLNAWRTLGVKETLNSIGRRLNAKYLITEHYNRQFYEAHGFWKTLQRGKIFSTYYFFLEKPLLALTNWLEGRDGEHARNFSRDWRELLKKNLELSPHIIAEYEKLETKKKIPLLNSHTSVFKTPKKLALITTSSAMILGANTLLSFPFLTFSHPGQVILATGIPMITIPIIMGYGVIPLYYNVRRYMSTLIQNWALNLNQGDNIIRQREAIPV